MDHKKRDGSVFFEQNHLQPPMLVHKLNFDELTDFSLEIKVQHLHLSSMTPVQREQALLGRVIENAADYHNLRRYKKTPYDFKHNPA